MRERLSMNIKQLPALAATWPDGPERSEVPEPSAFASTSTRQLQILRGVLEPLLLPAELHSIFGRIALMYSRTLAEAYTLLEPHGGAWEQQLRADVQALLNCLSHLPMEPAERGMNIAALTQLFEQRFVVGAAQRAPAPPPHTPALVTDAGGLAASAAHSSPSTAAATDDLQPDILQAADVPTDSVSTEAPPEDTACGLEAAAAAASELGAPAVGAEISEAESTQAAAGERSDAAEAAAASGSELPATGSNAAAEEALAKLPLAEQPPS